MRGSIAKREIFESETLIQLNGDVGAPEMSLSLSLESCSFQAKPVLRLLAHRAQDRHHEAANSHREAREAVGAPATQNLHEATHQPGDSIRA